MTPNPKSQRFIFYLICLAINFWQAAETELLADEAYYWVFSEHMAWGFFDQPPMIAAWIKMGYYVFQNELGVRFFPTLFFTAGIFFLEKIIAPKRFILFATLIASLGALHFLSCFATPDAMLFFFGALYLFLYKKQLEAQSAWHAVLLGVTIGLLLLSKYHGGLLVLFTLLSNPKLLRTKAFWVTTFVALLVFTPHMYWLWQHDFVSIKYHLGGRGPGTFEFRNVLNYVLSILLFYAPFTGLLLFYGVLKNEMQSSFHRSLKFILFGILLFCLLLTIRGNIEINWIALSLQPLVILGYSFLEKNPWAQKLHFRFFALSLILIFLIRFSLGSDRLGNYLKDTPVARFHMKTKTAHEIRRVAGEQPVVFLNSFQRAALYSFYSKQDAASFNSFSGRKNQYDLWSACSQFNGDIALFILNYNEPALDTLVTPTNLFSYYKTNLFYSMEDVLIELDQSEQKVHQENIEFKLKFNQYEKHLNFVDQKSTKLCLYLYTGHKNTAQLLEANLLSRDMLEHGCNFKLDKILDKGAYSIGFGLECDPLPPTLNSYIFSIEVF